MDVKTSFFFLLYMLMDFSLLIIRLKDQAHTHTSWALEMSASEERE